MKEALQNKEGLLKGLQKKGSEVKLSEEALAKHQIDGLLELIAKLLGPDKMVLKATKLNALTYLRSENLTEKKLALKRLIYEDPTQNLTTEDSDLPQFINKMKDKIAEIIAYRSLEEQLEQQVVQIMQERQEKYFNEVKLQIVKSATPTPENAQTLKRLALLEKKNATGLARSAMEALRPTTLEEIVGQKRGVKSLLAKMSSPYPQHILIYGPPELVKPVRPDLFWNKLSNYPVPLLLIMPLLSK